MTFLWSNETVSQVKIIEESPAQFPTVSLCDSNPYTTANAYAMLDSITLSLTKDLWGSAYSLKQLGFFYYYLHWRDISNNLYSYAISYTTQPDYNETQRKLLGWNLSQVIT